MVGDLGGRADIFVDGQQTSLYGVAAIHEHEGAIKQARSLWADE